MTEEQLVNLQKYAPSFWAQLDDDTRNYATQIVDGVEQITEALEQEMENATGISFESFSDDILESLYDVEKGAEDIADDIADYMRKALIKAMYVKQYEPEMRKWYEMWAEATGDGEIDPEEQSALDNLKIQSFKEPKREPPLSMHNLEQVLPPNKSRQPEVLKPCHKIQQRN